VVGVLAPDVFLVGGTGVEPPPPLLLPLLPDVRGEAVVVVTTSISCVVVPVLEGWDDPNPPLLLVLLGLAGGEIVVTSKRQSYITHLDI